MKWRASHFQSEITENQIALLKFRGRAKYYISTALISNLSSSWLTHFCRTKCPKWIFLSSETAPISYKRMKILGRGTSSPKWKRSTTACSLQSIMTQWPTHRRRTGNTAIKGISLRSDLFEMIWVIMNWAITCFCLGSAKWKTAITAIIVGDMYKKKIKYGFPYQVIVLPVKQKK